MALQRSASSRRGSKNDSIKDEEEVDNNGYVQVLVKPLERSTVCTILSNWFGPNEFVSPDHVGIVYGIAFFLTSFVVYQICDMGLFFQRMCSFLVPMFATGCAFYWLAFYLRKTWSNTSVYMLFCACFFGETFAQLSFGQMGADPNVINQGNRGQPLVLFVVLLAICGASIISSLETFHSAIVITLISFSRFLSCSSVVILPLELRPYLAYFCAFCGFIVSKYMETVLKPPINNFMTQDGKIPVIKRRRSSSSNLHAYSAHRSTRRTSLPALIPKSQNSSDSPAVSASSSTDYEPEESKRGRGRGRGKGRSSSGSRGRGKGRGKGRGTRTEDTRGATAGRGKGAGRGKRKKTGVFELTEEETERLKKQKQDIKETAKDLVESLTEREAKDILLEAAETIPTMIMNIREKHKEKSNPDEPAPGPSQPAPGPGFPDWCICRHCRETLPEDTKVCCNYRPELCQSVIPEIELITDVNVLTMQRLYRNDVFARHNATPEEHNKAMRHAGYRQYILFEYGRLGRGVRRPVPSCVTWYIRDKFPDPNGIYVPYVPSW